MGGKYKIVKFVIGAREGNETHRRAAIPAFHERTGKLDHAVLAEVEKENGIIRFHFFKISYAVRRNIFINHGLPVRRAAIAVCVLDRVFRRFRGKRFAEDQSAIERFYERPMACAVEPRSEEHT